MHVKNMHRAFRCLLTITIKIRFNNNYHRNKTMQSWVAFHDPLLFVISYLFHVYYGTITSAFLEGTGKCSYSVN